MTTPLAAPTARALSKPEIRPVLVFHRAAYGDVVIAVPPVTGEAFHEPLYSFGQENKIQVPAFPDHVPAFAAPWVRLPDEKIRGEAQIHGLAGFHSVISLFILQHGGMKIVCFHDLVRIHSPPSVGLMNIT